MTVQRQIRRVGDGQYRDRSLRGRWGWTVQRRITKEQIGVRWYRQITKEEACMRMGYSTMATGLMWSL